ncbi:MAG: hypothetical protein GC162_05810 [Planctomycetes bacterium]|nr:hypothetical protein [Planctomycetota bacterium]
MFHRRLLLLMFVFALATSVLAGQIYRLTILQGPAHREEAEKVLSSRTLVPTVRGAIYDAKGRVLAEDRPCYDIEVDYDVITGEWAYRQARKIAYRDYKSTWAKMSFDDRESLIDQYRTPFDARLEDLWTTMCRLGGIDRAELERRKEVVTKRVQTIRADVWDRKAQRRAEETGGPVELDKVAVKVAEEDDSHTLLPSVSDDVAFEFRKLRKDDLPGLHVVESKARVYPLREVDVTISRASLPTPIRSDDNFTTVVHNIGAHVLGSMRDAWAEDEQVRPFYRPGESPDLGGYLPGDRVGLGGVEAAEEARLRGERGQLLHRKDTDQVTRTPPVPGHDVHLTIDMALQARIRALMDPDFGLMQVQAWHGNKDTPIGTPLFGSVCVLEVDSGHVLAMVSTPLPPARVEGEPYPDLTKDPDRPLVNKAIGAVYPPGSTVKPLVYCMAASTKHLGWDQVVDCQGHLLPDKPNIYRCWGWRPEQGKYGRHGPLAPSEAIARSCNIYFYTCGRNLGAEEIVTQFMRWGFGKPVGLGLPEEVDGLLPNLDGRNVEGRELSLPNAIMMGIGQGPIAVPPIQVAAAHAALARGGYYLSPLLITDRAGTQDGRDLNIPPHVIANALEGMKQAANSEDYGTANHLTLETGRERILTLPGVTVRAKTGTAQAPAQFEDANHNGKLDEGERIIRDGDHSWFVCHVQRPGDQRAAFIIVVMVEYGGSGGRVSGPVANQVLYALRDEGYL